jgi:rod shape-determining protein MreD
MSRQYAAVFITGGLLAVLQTTLLHPVTASLQIDFLFVMVVIIGLFKDPVHGSIWSASLGLISDNIAGNMSGILMATRLSVFILAQTLRGRLSPETPLSQFGLALGLGVFDHIVLYLLQAIFAEPLPFSGRIFGYMILGIVVNAALVPVFHFLFSQIPGFIEKPRGPAVTE